MQACHRVVLAFAAASSVFSLAQSPPKFKVTDETVPGGVGYVLAADLDGDGDTDLLAPQWEKSALNDGSGRFFAGLPSGSPLFLGSSNHGALWEEKTLLADFNGDGVKDLLGALNGTPPFTRIPRLRLGLSGGGFSPATTPLTNNLLNTFPLPTFDAGDYDGDGDLDVVCVWGEWPPMHLLRNDGVGGFLNVTFSSGIAWGVANAHQARLADLDGDGLLDVVVAAVPPDAPYSWLRNAGGGSFLPPAALPSAGIISSSDRRPVVADFDGDGQKDVLLVGSPSASLPGGAVDTIALARQTSPGVFATAGVVPFAPGAAPFRQSVATAADLNGDGDAELIVVGERGTAMFDYVGGAFVPLVPEIPAPGMGVAAFDADGDADIDVLVEQGFYGSRTRYRMLINAGVAGFEAPREGIDSIRSAATYAAMDVEGDGDLDYVAFTQFDWTSPTYAVVAHNDGFARFSPMQPLVCTLVPEAMFYGLEYPLTSVAPGDFDGDGDDDLFVSRAFGLLGPGSTLATDAWLRNDGPAGFTTLVVGPGYGVSPTGQGSLFGMGVAVADFNGDGLDDAVTTSLYTSVYLSTSGVPLVLTGGQPPTTAYDVKASDMDGDGDVDLLLKTSAPFAAIWVNPGTGVFTLGPLLTGTPNGDVAAGDFTGDGLVDVVQGQSLFVRTGPTTFAAPTPLPVPLGSARSAFDVDGDGDADLVSSTATLRNNGGGAFTALAPLPPAELNAGFAGVVGIVGDLDGDADLDLLRPGPAVYSNLTRHLASRAPLRPGFWSGLDVMGAPNVNFLLAFDLAAAPYGPFAYPFGDLHLNPATAALLFAGSLDAGGMFSFETPLDLASWSTISGTTFVFQAVVGPDASPRFTNALRMTVYAP